MGGTRKSSSKEKKKKLLFCLAMSIGMKKNVSNNEQQLDSHTESFFYIYFYQSTIYLIRTRESVYLRQASE